MNNRSLILAIAGVAFVAGSMAHADVLLVDRAKQGSALDSPARGMSMAQVEARFGAPTSKLDPAGGDTKEHPVINRWVYPAYTVYFERDRVISSVMNHGPNELGPKSTTPQQQ
jgi:hypothetical protein